MNVKHGIVLVCILALSSFVIAQSSVDGTWTGEVQGGRGPQQITLTLKVDSGKLTGTVGGGRGGEVTLNWTGTVKGDEIAFSRMVEGGQGQAQEFTLKKQT